MVAVLFVCLGNICRSPAAEGILRHKHGQRSSPIELHVASCGVGDWHVGQMPVETMRQAAAKRNVVLAGRAQKFDPAFFEQFDLILAADQSVLNVLYELSKSPEHKAKIRLITDFSSSYHREEIPDPYELPEGAFELVLDMLEDACDGLIEHLHQREQGKKQPSE
jgi:protein-tyrosine phosphatase